MQRSRSRRARYRCQQARCRSGYTTGRATFRVSATPEMRSSMFRKDCRPAALRLPVAVRRYGGSCSFASSSPDCTTQQRLPREARTRLTGGLHFPYRQLILAPSAGLRRCPHGAARLRSAWNPTPALLVRYSSQQHSLANALAAGAKGRVTTQGQPFRPAYRKARIQCKPGERSGSRFFHRTGESQRQQAGIARWDDFDCRQQTGVATQPLRRLRQESTSRRQASASTDRH
jgi:hypothetical protein